MGNKKSSAGVQATIERLTGQKPCPKYLRETLNKYLYADGVFEGGRSNRPKRLGKLVPGETDALVMNALSLDQVFVGDTTTVARIIKGEIPDDELRRLLGSAAADLQRRFEAYGYWVQRMDQLKALLLNGKLDLKAMRIDESIKSPSESAELARTSSFALRAVQQLERIEETGRLGGPSARELTEQADGYFALGNYAKAAEKAAKAVEVDPKNAQAWFIQVMVLLRLRNNAVRKMHCHELNATELAEPMSSHETVERELAEEVGGRAYDYNKALNRILPEALLNWPRVGKGMFSYEYKEERRVVRDLLIDAVFRKVAHQRGNQLDFSLNGMGAGWSFPRARELWRQGEMGSEGTTASILTDHELEALKLLLAERDSEAGRWGEVFSKTETGREFKLLHLRWALLLDGYREHWQELKERIANRWSLDFEQNILSSGWLTRFWQFHAVQNDGVGSVVAWMDQWHAKTLAERTELSNSRNLRQYGYLFHDRLVRGDYEQCRDIAVRAQALCDDAMGSVYYLQHGMDSPDDESIWMPVGCKLYWKYLEVLAVMQIPPPWGGEHALSLLLSAEKLVAEFRDEKHCFWRQVDADDSAGEFEIPPYDIDLRDAELWLQAATVYTSGSYELNGIEDLYPVMQRLSV